MALRMVCSSMPEPVTMMRNCGRGAFRQDITSSRLWQLPRSTRSMFCCAPMSGNEAEISSKSGSESNRAWKPANRSGSLSTTAIRISGFLVGAAFMAFCFPLRDIAISITAFAETVRITAVTLRWLLPFPKTEQNTDFGDPARWKNAIVRRRLQFLAAVIDGEGQHVSERIGQEEEIYPTSAHRLAPRASESYASREGLA